ncbi:MAG: tetratricopeptide repeat protein [Gemmataceae bacterium]|nr:tetratricopeptide repeat protein [Gemmataceae bacterium]
MTDIPPSLNANLPGGYRLLNRLGRGAYGEVWRAEAPGGVEVAIKVIERKLRPEEAQRELDGLQLMKRLRHPFLLSLQGFFALEDQLIIVLELAEQSLRQRLHECRRTGEQGIPVSELLRYIKEAAEALDYLHASGVQHRDIKPDNLLLLGRHIQVADYGLARTLESTNLQMSTTVGTPAYMAPEVWEGKVREQSDQYSLGITYVELRLNRIPFDAENMMQMAHHHLHAEPDLSGLGPTEQEVLKRALAKDTTRRFASCSEFARSLARAVASDSARAQAGVVLDASLFGSEGSTLFDSRQASFPPPLPPLPPLPALDPLEAMEALEAQKPLAPLAPSTAYDSLQAPYAGVPGNPTGPAAGPLTGHPVGLVLPAGRETIGPSSARDTTNAEEDPVEASRYTQRPRTTTGEGKNWREPEPPAPSRWWPTLLVGCVLVVGVGLLLWQGVQWFNAEPTPVAQGPGPVEPPKPQGVKPAVKPDKVNKEKGPEQVIKPKAQLRLSPGGPVTLEEGTRGSLEVSVKREHCDGAVQLEVAGLPPRVRARPVTLPAGQDKARIELEADEGAAGVSDVTVRARLGEVQAARTVRLTIQRSPPLRLLPLAPVAAQGGQTRIVGVRVERKRYQGPIDLRLEGLPEGVNAWSNRIPAGSNAGALALNIGRAPTIDSKVRVIATGGSAQAEGEFVLTIRPSQPPQARLAEDTAAIQSNPTDPVARQNRGHTYRELRDYDNALADCDEAVRLAPDQAIPHVSRGLVHLARRDHDNALADFNTALKLSPGYVPGYLNRGLAWIGKREYDKAITDLDEVLARDRKNVPALANRANAHRMKKDFERALADCAEAIRLDSTQAQAFNVRGLVRVAQGNLDEAISDYSTAIKLEPKYLFPHYNRGQAHAARKDYDRAIDDYTEALRIDPKFGTAYNERGNAYQRQKDHDRAIDDYTQAINLSPDHPIPRNNRGLAYSSKGLHDRAIEDHTEAIRLDSKYSAAYLGRANAHHRQRDYDRAIEDFNQAASLDAKHEKAANRPAAHYQRGLARMDKNPKGAIDDFTTAIRLRPSYALAYYKRGNVHLAQRAYGLALKDYDQAIGIDPKHAFAHHGRGNVHFDRQQYDQAIKDYTKAIGLNPDEPVHYNNRGNSYRATKDLKRAFADYDKAIKLKSDYAYPYHGRGNVYFDREEYDKAIEDFNTAIRLDGRNPFPYNDRGAAHGRKGEHYLAIKDYTRALALKKDYALAYANRCRAYLAVNDRIRAREDRDRAVQFDKSFDKILPVLD